MPIEIKFQSEIEVELIQSMGGDHMVVAAAKVSTHGSEVLAILDAMRADSSTVTAAQKELLGLKDGQSPAEASYGLINYLMKHRHGTPFEHSAMTFFVRAPLFVWREWHRHRIGFCLSGDSEILLESYGENSGRTLRKRKLADLWRRWHLGVTDRAHTRKAGASGYSLAVAERTRLLPQCRSYTCRVLNEDSQFFELGTPSDIIQSGIKELVTVKTSAGHALKCSRDHRILTRDGWVTAGELRKHDFVAVCGRRSKFAERQVPPSLRRGIGVWTSMQRNRLINEQDICRICGGEFLRSQLILDHRVPVVSDLTKALDTDNLQPICEDCARIKNAGEQALAKRGNIAGSKYVRVIETPVACGEEMTYDISMSGPWHNFVANGIVVHNSYNEESARYKQLDPIFYIPDRERPMMKVDGWKPGKPKFLRCDEDWKYAQLVGGLKNCYVSCYATYENNLALGIDPGLARDCLPVGIFSGCWVTTNPRGLMNFLSLRTHCPDAKFVSYPLYEIEVAAEACEKLFAMGWPLTYKAFVENGRVGP